MVINNIKPTNQNMDCSICCETVNKNNIVTCISCNNSCCNECFQNHLLISNLDYKCMHCKCKIGLDFIIMNTSKKWFDTKYKIHRQEALWKNEIPFIQDINTQQCAKAYTDAWYYLSSTNNIMVYNIDRLRNIIESVYEEPYDKKEVVKNKDRLIVLNSMICIQSYGKGWENFNFGTNEPRPLTSYLQKITYSCQKHNCHGIVSDSVCKMCETEFCKKCREILTSTHKCDEKIIASIRAILDGSHPCPKCATPISKISGCDQMFCTQCHATFSWETGAIITHEIHNPHYFEWLAKGGLQIPEKLNNQNMCNNFISYRDFVSCFSHEELEGVKLAQKKIPALCSLYEEFPSISYYIIAFSNMRASILNIRATSGNHVNIAKPDNHKFRVGLLAKEIDEQKFKLFIEHFERDYYKSMRYWEIYSTVFNIAITLFDNLYAYTHRKTNIKMRKTRKEYFHEIYCCLQKLLENANEKILYYDKVFGKDQRLDTFENHPFIKTKYKEADE